MSKEIIPKKSLGQHWLFDDTALNAMVESADVKIEDVVLEVGPGLGTLTEYLAAKAKKVIAVEFDQDLADGLRNKNIGDNLEIINQDILDFDLSVFEEGYKVVANIPYYLTSHLIRKLCESKPNFSTAVLLVQKEVAERVCAKPGQTSVLSISAQYYCEVSLGMIVGADLFTPPPKIDSQILILHRRKTRLFDDVDDEKFFKLVKAGFSERRKKIRSSLSGALRISKQEVDDKLYKVSISSDLRAQALTMEQWHDVYLIFKDSL